ncbi:MAG: MFS transporter [Candidatus Limnocylindrales bacterium]
MRWLRILYLSSGLCFGALYGFMPVLLRSKGFEPALIGLATSLGAVGYSIALPAWGHMGDIVSGPRRTLQMACIPAALFAVGLAAPLPVFGVILCVVVISAGAGPALALTDAMAVPALSDASRQYSGLRLIASLGGAGSSVACGLLYSQTGYAVAPLVFVAAMATTVLAAQFIPFGRDSERRRRAAAGPGRSASGPPHGRLGSVGEALDGRPRLLATLISIAFVFAGVNAGGTYMSLRISDLGGGPVQVGLVNGVAAFAEIPGLLLAGWLAWRLGLRRVLAVSSLGLAACLASWIVLVDPLAILVTRFASGICFGGIVVSYVLAMARLLPARLSATGQTLLQATGFGLAAIVANLAGGVLYGAAGALGVFGAGAVCAAIGGLIGLVALPAKAGSPFGPAVPAAASMAG